MKNMIFLASSFLTLGLSAMEQVKDLEATIVELDEEASELTPAERDLFQTDQRYFEQGIPLPQNYQELEAAAQLSRTLLEIRLAHQRRHKMAIEEEKLRAALEKIAEIRRQFMTPEMEAEIDLFKRKLAAAKTPEDNAEIERIVKEARKTMDALEKEFPELEEEFTLEEALKKSRARKGQKSTKKIYVFQSFH